jgi:type IV pilus assembly protein PilB
MRMEGNRVVIGVTKPDDVFAIDEVKHRIKVPGVKIVMITGFDFRGAMEIVGAGKEESNVDVSELLAEVGEGDVQVEKKESSEVNLEKEAAESPVIRYVNYIIQTAVKEGASDIHVEPAEKKLRVRFRIDGELFEMMNPPGAMSAAITSRLKIMANLDISERRLPQDGRIRCNVQGRKLDLRVSTLPTGYGEKTVMRILDTKSINVDLDNLGFDKDHLEVWQKCIDAPHGIVLVTGPTGSGKTTTLYADAREDRHDLRRGPQEPAASGPRRDHVGRNPRHGDRPHRGPGRAHGPLGAQHPAHQRRAVIDYPTGEHRP